MVDAMTRILKLKHDETVVDVVVEVRLPQQRDESWFSDWRIQWQDRERKGSAGGIDAIQALICALKIVGTEIYCSDEHQSGLLAWTDDTTGYGLPVPNGLRDLLIGDDAKYF